MPHPVLHAMHQTLRLLRATRRRQPLAGSAAKERELLERDRPKLVELVEQVRLQAQKEGSD